MPRVHPIFGIVAVPLLAACFLYQEYSYSDATTHRLDQLINNLNDPDSGVRQSAVEALGMIGKPAVEPLIATLRTAASGMQRSAAEQALGRIGEPAIEQLIGQLDEANSEEVRQSAVDALGAIGKPAVEPLIAALKNSTASTAADRDRQATKVFVLIGEPAVDSLIDLLKVKDTEDGWHARWSAAAALGEIKDPRSIDPLTASAHGDTDSDVRASALNALSTIESSAQSSPTSRDTNSDDQHSEIQSNSPAESVAENTANSDASKDSTRSRETLRDKQLDAHLAKAKDMWSSGNTQGALEECDAALSLDPSNAEASSLREKYTRALAILNGTSQ